MVFFLSPTVRTNTKQSSKSHTVVHDMKRHRRKNSKWHDLLAKGHYTNIKPDEDRRVSAQKELIRLVVKNMNEPRRDTSGRQLPMYGLVCPACHQIHTSL